MWEYIKTYNVPYCELYDKGFKRIGCIMCPFSGKRVEEAKLYPKYAENYRRSCIRAFDKCVADGKLPKMQWKCGDDMYQWWLNDLKREKEDDKLIPLFGLMGDESML